MKNRIRVLRAELAERVGVSRQAINAIENERHDPSITLAFAIARVLRAAITEVFIEEKR
jgi:putative transcriptional regulator